MVITGYIHSLHSTHIHSLNKTISEQKETAINILKGLRVFLVSQVNRGAAFAFLRHRCWWPYTFIRPLEWDFAPPVHPKPQVYLSTWIILEWLHLHLHPLMFHHSPFVTPQSTVSFCSAPLLPLKSKSYLAMHNKTGHLQKGVIRPVNRNMSGERGSQRISDHIRKSRLSAGIVVIGQGALYRAT